MDPECEWLQYASLRVVQHKFVASRLLAASTCERELVSSVMQAGVELFGVAALPTSRVVFDQTEVFASYPKTAISYSHPIFRVWPASKLSSLTVAWRQVVPRECCVGCPNASSQRVQNKVRLPFQSEKEK